MAWVLFLAGLAVLLVTILADRWVASHRDEQPESRPGRVDAHTVKAIQPVSPEMPSTPTESEVNEIRRTAKQQGCDLIRGTGCHYSTTGSCPYYIVIKQPKRTSQATQQPEQATAPPFQQPTREAAQKIQVPSKASEASAPASGPDLQGDRSPRNLPVDRGSGPEVEPPESDAGAREAEPSAPGPLERTSQDTQQPKQATAPSFQQPTREAAQEIQVASNASEASAHASGPALQVDSVPPSVPVVLGPGPDMERPKSDAGACEVVPSARGPLEGIRAVVERWNRAGRSRNLDLCDFAENLGASRWRLRRVLDDRQQPTAFYLVDDGLAQPGRRLYVLVGIGEWYTEQVALVFQGDQGPCGPGREVLVDRVLEPATFLDESEVSFDRMDLKYLLIPNYIRRGRVRVREPGRS